MTETGQLQEDFERNRRRLQSVAYRMLGSLAEAQDAVQEAWLRCSRTGAQGVENIDAWLTTIVVRVCLNALRRRTARREEPMGVHVPDPIVTRPDATGPEDEVLLADAVGLALQVVLDTLSPPERLAFVLHDLFRLSFEEIAPMLGRTPTTTRQLASRARRRVREADVGRPDDLARQREVVDAFFAAAHRGDLEALVSILDPDVLLRSDGGRSMPQMTMELRGAEAIANRAVAIAHPEVPKHPVLVNGAAGVLIAPHGTPTAVLAFTVVDGMIVEVDAIVDPERLGRLDLSGLVD